MSAENDEWSNGELVRSVKALMVSLDTFQGEIREAVRRIEDKYVTKEMLDARLAPVSERRNSTVEWIRSIVAPLLVGLIIAYIATRK